MASRLGSRGGTERIDRSWQAWNVALPGVPAVVSGPGVSRVGRARTPSPDLNG